MRPSDVQSLAVRTTQVEPLLLRQQAYVGGEWVDADSGDTAAVLDPATGDEVARVPKLGAVETRRAIEAAAHAFNGWRAAPAAERARVLLRFAELVLAEQEELALLLTIEQGKPLAESRSEVAYAASFLEWFSEEAKRVYGDVIPSPDSDKRIVVLKQPVGVTAGIAPWNFPAAMITRKAAPALAVGCPMIVRPSLQTPLTALALAALAEEAGMPRGVLSVVTGDASEICREFTSNPIVRKIGFTGSTQVGKLLMRQCADHVKRVSLELGGNAPFIIFDDADLDAAVAGGLACKFRNSGQTCVCANRFLVQNAVHDEFVDRFGRAVKALRVGSGLDGEVQIGPLIDEAGRLKVERHVADAVAGGAEVVVGGESPGGNFYAPTVLQGVRETMLMSREETFGPVAGIQRFETDDEAVRLANDTPFGLAAYVYAGSQRRIWRVAEALEYGIVGMNTGIVSTAVAPFGGVKESGIGREGSKYGAEEWIELKYLSIGGI